jgi:hypothetical protein
MKDFFDRVVVISLRRRADRMRRFLARVAACDWPFAEPQIFNAVDGNAVPCPRQWKSGGGAYGCQQSHLRVLHNALMDGVQRLLVMEDDAEFRGTFGADAAEFVKNVPADWECLMIGGQHMAPGIPVSDGVVRCKNTQRTHCYAVTREGMATLAKLWAGSVNHIDWDMGPFLGRREKTYAPSAFLVGQASSQSDISGRRNPTQFWTPPRKSLPLLWLQAPRDVAEQMREYGCHYGADLDKHGNDTGLNIAFPSPGRYAGGIKKFIGHVTWECESFVEKPGIATIWHPNATEACADALLADCAPHVIKADTFPQASDTALALFPELFSLRATPVKPPILLLKTPREIVESLRNMRLVHTGNWRDQNTGIDNGLAAIIGEGKTCLREWHSVLEKEANWTNSAVAVWHPAATKELAATAGRRVVVIEADNVDDARQQVEAAML